MLLISSLIVPSDSLSDFELISGSRGLCLQLFLGTLIQRGSSTFRDKRLWLSRLFCISWKGSYPGCTHLSTVLCLFSRGFSSLRARVFDLISPSFVSEALIFFSNLRLLDRNLLGSLPVAEYAWHSELLWVIILLFCEFWRSLLQFSVSKAAGWN